MLQLQNISLSLGGKPIYNKLNLTLNDGVKYALLGANGTGKTSLFRLIVKELELQEGNIFIPQNTVIGYLPQDVIFFGDLTVWEIANQAFEEIDQLKAKVGQLEQELEESDDEKRIHVISDRLHTLYSRLNWLSAHRTTGEIEKVLKGLGFRDNNFHDKIKKFSGGWQMRAFLAKLLLEDPDFLLLDEPTNHLDIVSLQWLEDFLRSYPGTVVFITHDRYFVDKLSKKILFIENQTITEYDSPYEKFEVHRQEMYDQWVASYENQQNKIKELEKFIDRFRYKATKARQVQSRVKELEKMDKIPEPYLQESRINIRFSLSQQSYKEVFQIRNLWFKYQVEWIIKELELDIYRGEKIAVIGPNGAGKTTLLKILAGLFNPQTGLIKTGQKLDVGFYAQHQIEQLNVNNDIYTELLEVATPETRLNIRSVLGAFLFQDDDQKKKISVLSGGEKARVALAKILVQPFNCLIMDEPTNHLDMKSREILLDALSAYGGTIIIVSHDRKFIDNFAGRTVYISSDHDIKEYPGNYSDFTQHFNRIEETIHSGHQESQSVKKTEKEISETKLTYSERKELNRKIEKIKKQISETEQQIAEKEDLKINLSARLSDSSLLKNDEIQKLSTGYQQVETELDHLNNNWLELTEQLEQAETRLNLN